MELRPCPQCGDANGSWAEALVDADGTMARRYHCACAGCGEPREFVFALPERPTPPRPGAVVTFGALDEASVLVDAGEWLMVADLCAQAAGAPGVSDGEACEMLSIAVAAMDEVLKFIPAGADAVPDTAFWSVAGRSERELEPGRFRRDRLTVVRDSYVDTRTGLE